MSGYKGKQVEYADLDFDGVKDSIIQRLKQDRTFNGANFEGSGLNILADILAYVNHMTNVTANMAANEMFLDSAQLRQSVVSKAKELGYRPYSLVTPRAKLRLTFTQRIEQGEDKEEHEKVIVPAGQRFTTSQSTVFSTMVEYEALPVSRVQQGTSTVITYQADIDVYEGYYSEYSYTVDTSNADQRFYIPSDKVDVSTLTVRVIPAGTTDVLTFTENDNINLLTPDNLRYFLHQNPDNFFEVVFGDGVLGRKLMNGDRVVLSYIMSNLGMEMNGETAFEKHSPIDGFSSYTIECIEKAQGGNEQETTEQIRYRASKMWKAQNRAVVKEDYNAIMLSEYPWIDSITTWGGQYNNPPQYGKVFFAIKPKHTEKLSDGLKKHIREDLIKRYNVVTVIPEIVDPDYIWVGVDTTVRFNAHKTIRSDGDIAQSVADAINLYFIDTVEDFNSTLYFSPLTACIDRSDKTIVASGTTLWLRKTIYLTPGEKSTPDVFSVHFSNPIVPGSFITSFFISGNTSKNIKVGLKDNGQGAIHMYQTALLSGAPLVSDVGDINYETGEVNLELRIHGLPLSNDIKLYASPSKKDIVQDNQQIIMRDRAVADEFWGVRKGTVVTMVPMPVNDK